MNHASTPVSVEIIPAAPEHLAEISALAGIIWYAHYPGIISREQIDYMLTRMYDIDVMRNELGTGVTYERLLIDGTLRGFASYGPTHNGSEMKLHKLYIHPNSQRQGLGALLLKHVENTARAHGCDFLVLAVNKKNTNAITAYRKNGFMIRKSIIVDIGGGFVMDDYVMVKALGNSATAQA